MVLSVVATSVVATSVVATSVLVVIVATRKAVVLDIVAGTCLVIRGLVDMSLVLNLTGVIDPGLFRGRPKPKRAVVSAVAFVKWEVEIHGESA